MPEPDDGVRGRGFTARGRWMLAGGAATCGVALVLAERDLLLLGVFTVLLPLVSAAVGWPGRPRLTATYTLTPSLTPGERGTVELRVRNEGSRGIGLLDVTQPVVPGLVSGERRVVRGPRSGAEVGVTIEVEARHRGRYRVGPPLLRLGDPLGMWQERRELTEATGEILVAPRVVDLAELPRTRTGRAGSSGGSGVGSAGGDPDVGLRPYRLGDDIRQISWRASARLEDDLVVRMAAPASLAAATIILDDRSGASDAVMDAATSVAASVGLYLLAQDVELTLVDHAGSVMLRGHDVADDLLAALADAGAEPDPAASEVHAHHLLRAAETTRPRFRPVRHARADLVVAVTGALTPDEIDALAHARGAGPTAVAVVVDGERRGPGPSGRRGSWAVAIGTATGLTGDPLPPEETALALERAGWRTAVLPALAPDPVAALATAWREVSGSAASGGSAASAGSTESAGSAGSAGGAAPRPARAFQRSAS